MTKLKLFQYQHKRVRSLTIDGQIWFVAKDVCEVLEIVNVRDAVSRLSDNQKRGVGITDAIGREQKSYVISESGVYKLAFRSNKPEAERFTDWLANDVIPEIRKTGQYVPKHQGILPLMSHTDIGVQKDMSKSVNAYNYERGGVEETIAYNMASCVAHTGKTTVQLKREAKEQGLKAKDRNSAKAVVRKTNPPKACCMSLADNLWRQGYNAHRVFDVSTTAEPVFRKMIELGATPAELNQDNKKGN